MSAVESQARLGYGMRLLKGDGASPEVFQDVLEVIDINPPGLTRNTVQTTHHLSPDGYHEFIAGFKDAGEVAFTVNWVPDHPTQNEVTGVLGMFENGQRGNFKMVIPTLPREVWQFRAMLTNYSPATPLEDRMTCDITLKISGRVNFNATL